MGTNELDFFYNLNYTCCELLLGTCLLDDHDLLLVVRIQQSWLRKANTLWIVEMTLLLEELFLILNLFQNSY